MKYCVNCGTEIEDDDLFCPDCGAQQPERRVTPRYDEDADIKAAMERARERAAEEEAERQREEEERRQRAEYSTMPCEYDFDIDICQEAAQGGWAPAQRNLGMCYLTGRAVNTDADEVLKGLLKNIHYDERLDSFFSDYRSSSLLHYEAETLPGDHIMDKDVEKGIMWLRMAAEQGDADAQFWLGECYDNSDYGVKFDCLKRDDWHKKGAENGGAYMQMYMGTNSNIDEAMMWFNKAAKQGNATARKALQQRSQKEDRRALVASIVDRYIKRINNGYTAYSSKACANREYYEVMNNVYYKVLDCKEDTADIVGFIDTTVFGNGKAGLAFTKNALYEKGAGYWMRVSYSEISDNLSVETNRKGAVKQLTFEGCYDGKGLMNDEVYILPSCYDLFTLRDCLLEIKAALGQ